MNSNIIFKKATILPWLTLWSLDKMPLILFTKLSILFLWMKISIYCITYHGNYWREYTFPEKLIMFRRWRNWDSGMALGRWQTIRWPELNSFQWPELQLRCLKSLFASQRVQATDKHWPNQSLISIYAQFTLVAIITQFNKTRYSVQHCSDSSIT